MTCYISARKLEAARCVDCGLESGSFRGLREFPIVRRGHLTVVRVSEYCVLLCIRAAEAHRRISMSKVSRVPLRVQFAKTGNLDGSTLPFMKLTKGKLTREIKEISGGLSG